ncbi:UNVERIFIED_CONTAM: mechanosensitive ion channel protein MscS [Euhalothece sp. KZN 001]
MNQLFAFQPLEFISDNWMFWENWELDQEFLILLGTRLGILLVLIILASLVSRIIPSILLWFTARSLPPEKFQQYKSFSDPFRPAFVTTLTLILVNISINILQPYRSFFEVINFIADFAVAVSAAWLVSKVAKQVIRTYGVSLIKLVSQDVNDLILIFENTINVIIGFFTVLIFAQSKNFDLVALLTGLGIGGIAVAFAAQEALSQILATVVIYLDRPYLPGEYVRINFVVPQEDVYGRIESIGLRSTKLRIAVSNTLLIVPNSLMVTKDIENISRGKKVMVLFFLDFANVLNQSERALVEQTLQDSLGGLFGVEQGSVRIATFEPEDKPGTRARVSFFLLSSSSSSLNIRKRLVEVANQEIAQRLQENQLQFSMEEPMIYVDSPVTK